LLPGGKQGIIVLHDSRIHLGDFLSPLYSFAIASFSIVDDVKKELLSFDDDDDDVVVVVVVADDDDYEADP